MNEIEKYQFDLNGYVLIKGLLNADETRRYSEAVDDMEQHVAKSVVNEAPNYVGHFGIHYHFDEKFGFSSYKSDYGGGAQHIVDDFINASSAFDSLVNHSPTMAYMPEFMIGPYRLGGAELRYRYKGNATATHMGGVIDPRNRYEFVGRTMLDPATNQRSARDFNLLVVRVIYALHDIPLENGAFCVVPGTHKSNFFSPYGDDPAKEPGMIGIPMEAGDGLFFTENLRHGGLPNLLDKPRKTIHLQIGPSWAGSQSPAHWNGGVYVSQETWQRYSEAQRTLFPSYYARQPPVVPQRLTPSEIQEDLHHQLARSEEEINRLRHEIDRLYQSKAWKITAPLRKAAELSRKLLK